MNKTILWMLVAILAICSASMLTSCSKAVNTVNDVL